MTTIEFPNEFTAQVRGQDFKITDMDKWPEVSRAKVIAYGLQRLFNDSAAGAKNGAEALELAGKRLDAMAKGVMRASVGRTGDPVKAEALSIATKLVVDAMRKAGFKGKDLQGETVRAKAVALIEKNPAITATAKANVEARAGLDITVEL